MLFFNQKEGIKSSEKRNINGLVKDYVKAIGGPLRNGFIESSVFLSNPTLLLMDPNSSKDAVLDKLEASGESRLLPMPNYGGETERFLKTVRLKRDKEANPGESQAHAIHFNANVVDALSGVVSPDNTHRYIDEIYSAANSLLLEAFGNLSSEKDQKIIREILGRIKEGIGHREITDRTKRDFIKTQSIAELLKALTFDALIEPIDPSVPPKAA